MSQAKACSTLKAMANLKSAINYTLLWLVVDINLIPTVCEALPCEHIIKKASIPLKKEAQSGLTARFL